MVMVPPEGITVCVEKVKVVTAVVACSGFWSATASVSEGFKTTLGVLAKEPSTTCSHVNLTPQ